MLAPQRVRRVTGYLHHFQYIYVLFILSPLFIDVKSLLVICHKCGISFEKKANEYNRQLRKGRKYFYCSLRCSQSENHTFHKKIFNKCLWCKNHFETSTRKKARKCCSKKCASKYSQSKVNPEIHKQASKKEKIFPIMKTFVCCVCNASFLKKVNNNIHIKKTCSDKCLSLLISKNSRNNPNCGGKLGYRRFPYKGIKMDSRWEVAVAKWMDDVGIKWDRNRKRHMFKWIDEFGNERKYFPDFYLPQYNIYLDPKNDYYLQRDIPKLKYVINKYGIKLLYGNVDDIKSHLYKLL